MTRCETDTAANQVRIHYAQQRPNLTYVHGETPVAYQVLYKPIWYWIILPWQATIQCAQRFYIQWQK